MNTLLLLLLLVHILFFKPSFGGFPPPPPPPPLILPVTVQEIPANSLPRSPSKLPFHHNISLTVSLTVGTPPQNVSMVLDTGSELTWLPCNKSTTSYPTTFDPTRSLSYRPIPCSSSTCTNQTRDFTIPASCDSNNLCHATLAYADASSSEGNLASDDFHMGSSGISGMVFGCMDSVCSSNSDEDSENTGLMGMNRGSLSFVSQMGFPKFSYCISGSDFSGVLLLGESNLTWALPLKYTPLIQMSTRLPILIGLLTRFSSRVLKCPINYSRYPNQCSNLITLGQVKPWSIRVLSSRFYSGRLIRLFVPNS